jgi:phage FluMu gp28-like protein
LAALDDESQVPRPDGLVPTGPREVSGQAPAGTSDGTTDVEVVDPESRELKNDVVLRRYQRVWVKDKQRFTIAVKAAQIGYSTASAAWAVDRCLAIPKRTIIFLSRSERQSLELAHRAKDWLDGYHGVAADWMQGTPFAGTTTLQHEIRFPNGSRIIALAANPDTARGYTGDVVLDEFAFHQDAQAIFTAVYRQVSLGYHMRVLSTPNGQRGKFWELARALGLDSGVRPAHGQPVRLGTETDPWDPIPHRKEIPRGGFPWSGHWCDIFMAVKDGLPLDPQEIQAGCDEDTWLQEYCCQFISQYSEWIPAELFQQCVSSDCRSSIDDFRLKQPISNRQSAIENLYAGWDIARNRDLSVIWFSELVGDVTWCRGYVEWRNMPTPDQMREARMLINALRPRKLNIDKGGMGVTIYEMLNREFPGIVEGVQFTPQSKEAMAVLGKRRMEEMKVRLPDSDVVRRSFRAVKRTTNAVGQIRLDAEHDTRIGHADHWWAFCLAETAAQQPVYHFKDVALLVGKPICSPSGLDRALGLEDPEPGKPFMAGFMKKVL